MFTLPATGETKLGFLLCVKKVSVIHISRLPATGEKTFDKTKVKKIFPPQKVTKVCSEKNPVTR